MHLRSKHLLGNPFILCLENDPVSLSVSFCLMVCINFSKWNYSPIYKATKYVMSKYVMQKLHLEQLQKGNWWLKSDPTVGQSDLT